VGQMTVVFQASDDQPISSRLERWRQAVDQTFGPALLRPPSRTHVPQQLVVGDVGAVQVSELRIAYPTPSPDRCRAARTPRLIRQSDPDPERYRVDLLVRGQMVVEQAGREAALEAGDFTVVDWSRPARWATASERSLSLMFPRALLALPHDQVARLGGVRISGRRGAGALFSSFARQVVAHLDDYGVADGARLGTTMVDLLTAALAARLDRGDEVPTDGAQEALRRRVHAFIEQRLADPALSPAVIAEAHHVSLRYLYKLFQGRDRGVAGWIRERRLERSRRDLLDPALAARPVSAIATRWGLVDPAHFSRLFRAAYGVPPLEYRRTMGRASSPG
jgi:AraC-like DNA-binding protein